MGSGPKTLWAAVTVLVLVLAADVTMGLFKDGMLGCVPHLPSKAENKRLVEEDGTVFRFKPDRASDSKSALMLSVVPINLFKRRRSASISSILF